MFLIQKKFLLAMSLLASPLLMAESVIVTDGDLEISDEELQFVVGKWTPQMREVALMDPGDRLELINMVVVNKRVANEAEVYVKDNPDLYWEYMQGKEAYQRNFLLQTFSNSIVTPDFTELAQEQYTVLKDKYASIPERRTSSHILFASPPGQPRDDVLAEAATVLAGLRAGEDFYQMVSQHSDEPGASERKGKFDRWLAIGEEGVAAPYVQGVFTIEAEGEYAELVETQFGVHIIRLDGIQEKSYKTFEDVRPVIEKELEADYRKLAMKDFISQFQMSEGVIIDNEAVDAILKPYSEKE